MDEGQGRRRHSDSDSGDRRHQSRRHKGSLAERDNSWQRDRHRRDDDYPPVRDDRSEPGPGGRGVDRRDRSRDRRYRQRDRSSSPEPPRRDRRRSRSPAPKRRRRSYSGPPSSSPPRVRTKGSGPLPSQVDSFRDAKGGADGQPVKEKEKPNFRPTGLLAKEANTVAGTTTVLKYHEPPEARKPPAKEAWRMYVFKGQEMVDTIHIHHRSCWLVGRDQKVTDLPLEHPSVSKQHAVIQFRHRSSTNQYGDKINKVKPYLIDLESANGTKLNGKRVEDSRYMELIDGDVVKFGDSDREFVMMLPPPDK